jgi:hypothetical protein
MFPQAVAGSNARCGCIAQSGGCGKLAQKSAGLIAPSVGEAAEKGHLQNAPLRMGIAGTQIR